MENNTYSFGAGGYKLGDRVEVMTTRQRGIIVSEIVHISGCNSYQVLMPNVARYDRKAIKNCDYLILRKLEANEAVFGNEDDLTDDTIFSPKGSDVNAEWIMASVLEGKEPIPEVDEAVGVEEITIQPGTDVWHKAYNIPMLVIYICRQFHSKELEYGLLYVESDKEISVCAPAYALIPLKQRFNVYEGVVSKVGSIIEDDHIETGMRLSIEDFVRYGDAV
jgi:hypothetical protein